MYWLFYSAFCDHFHSVSLQNETSTSTSTSAATRSTLKIKKRRDLWQHKHNMCLRAPLASETTYTQHCLHAGTQQLKAQVAGSPTDKTKQYKFLKRIKTQTAKSFPRQNLSSRTNMSYIQEQIHVFATLPLDAVEVSFTLRSPLTRYPFSKRVDRSHSKSECSGKENSRCTWWLCNVGRPANSSRQANTFWVSAMLFSLRSSISRHHIPEA